MTKVLSIYLHLYAGCLSRATAALRKSPWTLLLPIGLWLVMQQLSRLLGDLAMFLWFLLFAAGASSYLYFVNELVSGIKVKVEVSEFKASVGRYFWPVISVNFVFFIVRLALDFGLRGVPNGQLIYLLLMLGAFVLLNATPEVIYQRTPHGGIATIQEGFRFMTENWIEWFVPNLLAAGAIVLAVLALGSLGPVGVYAGAVAGGALLHVAMVFRGHLFRALHGSTHRQRMFRYRTGT